MIILYLKSILCSKSFAFGWVADFWNLTMGSANPDTFYGLSQLGNMSDHNWRAFHPREDLSLLADTRHIFFTILINRVTLLDVVLINRAHPINTKRSVDLSTMHSHPFNEMSPCICNAIMPLQVISYHIYDECYMDNLIHAYILHLGQF